MDKKEITVIIHRHCRRLAQLLNQVFDRGGLADIHDFRVQYKKFRAFLRLLDFKCKEGQTSRISKSLQQAYQLSGSIRDLQLQRQRITRVTRQQPGSAKAYLDLLKEEILALRPMLSSIIIRNPALDTEHHLAAVSWKKYKTKNIELFFAYKWNTLEQIINARNFSEENVHAIRKILKDIFYTEKDHGKGKLSSLPFRLSKRIYMHSLKQLLHELGQFHDKCVALALLRTPSLSKLDQPTRVLMIAIKADWSKEKAKMKTALLQKIKWILAPTSLPLPKLNNQGPRRKKGLKNPVVPHSINMSDN